MPCHLSLSTPPTLPPDQDMPRSVAAWIEVSLGERFSAVIEEALPPSLLELLPRD